ncbi:MAG: radical SAM protein [Desulfobacterales bacterium]|nr:radical SAM protein [Desulfobacterales bacterium]
MHYEGIVIRPPSESQSILLQATLGCSHNKCTFCGTYKGQRFKIKSDEIINADIDFASQYGRRQNRLFICDGDALIIPQPRLLSILKQIQKKLPWIERVGSYANTKSLSLKTDDELKELKEHGLDILYMGLESGDDITLERIHKGADAQKMIAMGKKARNSGMKLSVTVLLGIAGQERSDVHARETGRVLSEIDPEYVGALSLMLIPGTPLYTDYESGKFVLLNAEQMLRELKTMIVHTELSNGRFHANHASNYLPIKATFPKDKPKTIESIDKALKGQIALKPEFLRAL